MCTGGLSLSYYFTKIAPPVYTKKWTCIAEIDCGRIICIQESTMMAQLTFPIMSLVPGKNDVRDGLRMLNESDQSMAMLMTTTMTWKMKSGVY